jgi:hypothetical protein
MDLPVKLGTAIIATVLTILAVAVASGVGIPAGPELLLVTVLAIPLYVVYRVGRWAVGRVTE